MEILHQIVKDVCNLESQGYDGGMYCIASHEHLNCETFMKLDFPEETPFKAIYTKDVDMRDGFCTDFFDADIILVCNPAQVHLGEEHQRIITTLNDIFLGEPCEFTEKYELTEEYDIDYGITVYMFVKHTELDKEDILYVKGLYQEYYADYPELFANRFDDYILQRYGR